MPDLPAGLSQSQMRERIRNERRVELAYEEHRYFDVRRWMIAEDVENQMAGGVRVTKNNDGSFTYEAKEALTGKSFATKHYWFPIPIEEINASNGAIAQNPQY
jgi:hypothetical protein